MRINIEKWKNILSNFGKDNSPKHGNIGELINYDKNCIAIAYNLEDEITVLSDTPNTPNTVPFMEIETPLVFPNVPVDRLKALAQLAPKNRIVKLEVLNHKLVGCAYDTKTGLGTYVEFALHKEKNIEGFYLDIAYLVKAVDAFRKVNKPLRLHMGIDRDRRFFAIDNDDNLRIVIRLKKGLVR